MLGISTNDLQRFRGGTEQYAVDHRPILEGDAGDGFR